MFYSVDTASQARSKSEPGSIGGIGILQCEKERVRNCHSNAYIQEDASSFSPSLSPPTPTIVILSI